MQLRGILGAPSQANLVQLADVTIAAPWRMASRGKGNYFVKEGLLCRTENRFGQTI